MLISIQKLTFNSTRGIGFYGERNSWATAAISEFLQIFERLRRLVDLAYS